MRSPTVIVFLLACTLLVLLPEVSAKRYIVGGNQGWSPNANYTVWAKDKHFYLGDWLFFVYDRNQNNVLEVNKTNYDSCNQDHILANFTTGAGRDVVHLNQTRHYYFISGNGFCFGGMKLAVNVVKPPPPPTAAPIKSDSPSANRSYFILPVAFTVAVVWDSFLRITLW